MVSGMDIFPMWWSTRWQPSPTASGRLLDYIKKSEAEIELEPPSSPLRATTIMHKVRQIIE